MIGRKKREGFVLSLVIVAFGLLGVAMLVLTEGSNTMLFQADTSYLQAVERNLKTSGLAWAQHQVRDQGSKAPDGPVSLDVEALSSRPATLTVQFQPVGAVPSKVRIDTTCRKGRQVQTDSTVLAIP